MNAANFIITSTQQEITGDDSTMGQYESYQFFSMPDLYTVSRGVNLFHPKFNVVPPGVNEEINFPFYEKKKRNANQTKRLQKMLFEETGDEAFGKLEDPTLPVIFTMARLDKVKNLTGLVEAYGKSDKLQKYANLIVIGGTLLESKAKDGEEIKEMHKMYSLLEKYKLEKKVRWLSGKSKTITGELYRIIADGRGIFVQPALYEAFGLTVIESMHCGLPTFATQFGGPLETIEDGKSGRLINPRNQAELTKQLLSFFESCEKDPAVWDALSEGGIKRARERYTWDRYAEQFLRLAKLYSFWRFSVSSKEKRELVLYCDLLYNLLYLQRAGEIQE